MPVLTDALAAKTAPPPEGETTIPDSKLPGLALRVRAGGSRTFTLRYRAVLPDGSPGPQRRATIGPFPGLSVSDARAKAKAIIGRIAEGGDPVGEQAARQEAAAFAADRAAARTPEAALLAYGADLAARGVVKRGEVVSALRRGLCPLGEGYDLSRLDLPTALRLIAKVPGAGAAAYFEKCLKSLCQWLAARRVIPASPFAGYRRPRRTRMEALDRPGRALDDAELSALWGAAGAIGYPFGPLVQILLLTGLRLREAARSTRGDLDPGDTSRDGLLTIPAARTKTGRAHAVPVPRRSLLQQVLSALPMGGQDQPLFMGRGGKAVDGFSDRMAGLRALLPGAAVRGSESLHEPTPHEPLREPWPHEPFTLHDLRRTFRSGLSRIGIAQDVAESCIGHVRGELAAIYDRHDFKAARAEAVAQWSAYVRRLVSGVPVSEPVSEGPTEPEARAQAQGEGQGEEQAQGEASEAPTAAAVAAFADRWNGCKRRQAVVGLLQAVSEIAEREGADSWAIFALDRAMNALQDELKVPDWLLPISLGSGRRAPGVDTTMMRAGLAGFVSRLVAAGVKPKEAAEQVALAASRPGITASALLRTRRQLQRLTEDGDDSPYRQVLAWRGTAPMPAAELLKTVRRVAV